MDPFTQSRELLYFLAAHTGQEARAPRAGERAVGAE